MTDEENKLITEIRELVNKLEKHPDGFFAPWSVVNRMPPSKEAYLYDVNLLWDKVKEFNSINESIPYFNIDEMRNTMTKEVKYLEFTDDSKKIPAAMRTITKQIKQDLYFLLEH